MEIKVIRFSTSDESTLGLMLIDGSFECYTLEDSFRSEKVPGETRIPTGRYKVRLRKEGTLHNRYSKRFPDIHKGMLHITKVPNFEYILIHCGNDAEDTAGCLLVGDELNNNKVSNGHLKNSTQAYVRVYPKICEAIKNNEEVWIEYSDDLFITPEKSGNYGLVNVDYLNVRDTPNGNGLGVIFKDTKVEILEDRNKWICGTIKCWVNKVYLK